jgi:hypothetical protein
MPVWVVVLLVSTTILTLQAQVQGCSSSKDAHNLLLVTVVEDDHPALDRVFGALVLKMARSFSPRYARVACYRQPGHVVESRVYLGSSEEQVLDRFDRGSYEWCGMGYMMNKTMRHGRGTARQGSTDDEGSSMALFCEATLPVVCSQCVVGVDVLNGRRSLLDGYGLKRMKLLDRNQEGGDQWQIRVQRHGGDDGSSFQEEYRNMCIVEDVKRFSIYRLGVWFFGACIVSFAPILSTSTSFRLTGGSLAFVTLSGVFLLYIVWKNVPQKKAILSSFVLFGSALIGCIKFFGMNISSILSNPLYSSLLAAYLVASGLVGAAITYYFNDESNEKLSTLLKVALQMFGVFIMYMSTTSPEAAVLLICLWMVYQSGVMPRIWKHRVGRGLILRASQDVVDTPAEENVEFPLHPSGIAARTPEPGDGKSPGHSETPGTPTVFRVSTVTLPPTPEDFADQQNLHELVQRGKILNVETDRAIAIGKGTYNTLFMKGYEVDFEKGTITPPDKKTR